MTQRTPPHRRPIGVFDSGLGGLTVVQALLRILPGEKVVYFGDTARIPYGSKSPDTVLRYSQQILHFLSTHDVKFAVVACNTASSLALPRIKPGKFPLLGVLEPGARAAVEVTRTQRIGVIGTEGTIRSNAYPRAIHALRPGAHVVQQACPLFVPLVEEGRITGPVVEAVARGYLKPLMKQRIDTLLLGCTHYPILKRVLQKVVGRNVRIIDSAEETAKTLRLDLEMRGLRSQGKGGESYFVSDISARFKEQAALCLGRPIHKVKRVLIEQY
jgi:glutamate racemase